MIFQSLMGLGKSRCDIPSDTTQGLDNPPPNFKFQAFFHSQVPIKILHVQKMLIFITLTTLMRLKGVFVIMLRYLK
jgi:hypothetical protein